MTPEAMHAALASWRETSTKSAILDFLHLVTAGAGAVPVERRLAAFDDDGTLAPEKPTSALSAFLESLPDERRAATLVQHAGELFPGLTGPGTQELVADRFDGKTVEEFESQAAAFLRADLHPRFGRPWPALTYAPMFELAALLRELQFTVYVVSGSSRDFLRTMAESAYGARREHVIGTEVEVEYRDGRLVRKRKLNLPDQGPGKPAHLWDRTGGTALLAAGNTMGDLELLDSARFALLVNHDDADREYSYTDQQALAASRTHGWTTVSMRRDFATIFANV
ncbi:MAG TPA: HAD family hydrolase [Amnibacterium sp.]|jgi:phosphoserine phosphatase|uniref:HAD family hydrolase n=1 Tax=Amnibacterium sp. TaxID=1872496 RepID=UPI002F920870